MIGRRDVKRHGVRRCARPRETPLFVRDGLKPEQVRDAPPLVEAHLGARHGPLLAVENAPAQHSRRPELDLNWWHVRLDGQLAVKGRLPAAQHDEGAVARLGGHHPEAPLGVGLEAFPLVARAVLLEKHIAVRRGLALAVEHDAAHQDRRR